MFHTIIMYITHFGTHFFMFIFSLFIFKFILFFYFLCRLLSSYSHFFFYFMKLCFFPYHILHYKFSINLNYWSKFTGIFPIFLSSILVILMIKIIFNTQRWMEQNKMSIENYYAKWFELTSYILILLNTYFNGPKVI